jgi:hypothetical protein
VVLAPQREQQDYLLVKNLAVLIPNTDSTADRRKSGGISPLQCFICNNSNQNQKDESKCDARPLVHVGIYCVFDQAAAKRQDQRKYANEDS